MSWDLLIALAEPPKNVPSDPAFTIAAPVGVALEDLPEALAAAVDVGRALLDGLRTACPEAMPRRYGDFEPLQHKLETSGEQPFIDFWARYLVPAEHIPLG